MEKYTYLLVNLLSVSIPFIATFDRRLSFHRQWKYFFPAMGITLAFFIIWDVLYTHWGIWGFNSLHLTGVRVINLPLEEWLFFVCIPYASVFTYHALNYLIRKDILGRYAYRISIVLIVILILVAVFNTGRLYTSVTFFLTAVFLILHIRVFRSAYLGRFYLTYAIILLPFFMVNGILTGSFIREEVVFYDDTMNLGIRLFTIPIEDSVYGLLLILMNVTFYEWFKSRQIKENAGAL
ncbi:MAG: lycopene cyclase domain-containing protein [Bacteroidales bacterium]|nr:lycopene cyclase domain-containing protein [Bacteroidales bacterium]